MTNKIYIAGLTIVLATQLLSCMEDKPVQEEDFLPKITLRGVWSNDSSKKISRVIKYMRDIPDATDDIKDATDYLQIKENNAFVSTNKKAFFVIDTQNMKNETYKNTWGGVTFGKFVDNYFEGEFYSFAGGATKKIKITTPIDNYELIDKKARFRYKFDGVEYKGAIAPSENIAPFDVLADTRTNTDCDIKANGLVNNTGSFSAQVNHNNENIKLIASLNLCSLKLDFTTTHTRAGELIEFETSLNISNCDLQGSYAGIGYAVSDNSTKKLVSALVDGKTALFISCNF